MARMPGVEWAPLGPVDTTPRMTPLVAVLHSMGGTYAGTDSWFRSGNGPGFAGTESHFLVAFDGRTRQVQDTGHRADANLDGNAYAVSIETEDANREVPWTAQQIEAIARILAWLYATHNIPLIRTRRANRYYPGVATHREGIDPWRKAGDDHWSTAAGKTCPRDIRLPQVDAVIARARQLAGVNGPVLTQPTPQGQELHMSALEPTEAQQLRDTHRALMVLMGWEQPANDKETALAGLLNDAAEARRMLGVLLGHQLPAPQTPEATALAALRAGNVTTGLDLNSGLDSIAARVADVLSDRLRP